MPPPSASPRAARGPGGHVVNMARGSRRRGITAERTEACTSSAATPACSAAGDRRGSPDCPPSASRETRRMTLLAVDDGRVLGVEAQDVLRLVIDVVDLRDTAVRHGGRYARIAGR